MHDKRFLNVTTSALCLLVGMELLAIGSALWPYGAALPDAAWVNAGLPVRSALAMLLVFGFYLLRLKIEQRDQEVLTKSIQIKPLAINLASFAGLVFVFVNYQNDLTLALLVQGNLWLYVLYGFLMVGTLVSGFCLLVSETLGRATLSAYQGQIVFLAGFALLLYNFASLSQSIGALWYGWFGLFTVEQALWLTQSAGLDPKISWLWYGDQVVNFPVIESGQYRIAFTQACSGFQSISLYLLIMAAYLFVNRATIGFFSAVKLLALSSIFLFCLNIVRVAVLVVIAEKYSVDIAMHGFHTSSGWFYLIMVVMTSIFYFDRVISSGNVSKSRPTVAPADVIDSLHLIVPLMIYLAMSITVQMVTGFFNWLYPIPVVITGLYVVWKWPVYKLCLNQFGLLAMVVGAAVGIFWFNWIPIDVNYNDKVNFIFSQTSEWVFTGWLVFRMLGAIIVVPFIEELAFRGYLLDSLGKFFGENFSALSQRQRLFMSVAGSSVIFGLFHNDMIAATIEGAAYALVKLKTGRLSDAIACHATANAVLAAYVLHNNYWNYW